MSQRVELNKSIEISAPKEAVWTALWTPEHYERWTYHFHPGSRYEGTVAEGNVLRFLGPESENSVGGMASKIVKLVPNQECLLVSEGMIVNGEIVKEGEGSEDWVGVREEYRITETANGSVLSMFQEIPDTMKEYFDGVWDKALAELKEIAESLA